MIRCTVVGLLLLAATLIHRPITMAGIGQQVVRVEDLVIVNDDVNRIIPGCDNITVYDLTIGEVVHRGDTATNRVSPGRMSANADLTLVLAINANAGLDRSFIALYRRHAESSTMWSTSFVTGTVFTEQGDIALLPDEDAFLVAVGDNHWRDSNIRDWYVKRFLVSDIRRGVIGPPLAEVQLDLPAARIIPSPDGRFVHVLENTPDGFHVHRARVRTFDAVTLAESARPIDIAPITYTGRGIGNADMALEPSGRYALTNISNALHDVTGPRRVNIVDLVRREARQATIGNSRVDVQLVGGMAFNRGWVNSGVLAVHGLNRVLTFRLDDQGMLAPMGSVDIPGLSVESNGESAPWQHLAWSGSGGQIIAAANHPDMESDFAVIDVTDGGMTLNVVDYFQSCMVADEGVNRLSRPQEIITANGMPQPTAEPPNLPGEAPECVCKVARDRLPAVVLADALANPESIYGWQQPRNPGVAPGPGNPPRTCLSLTNPNVDYHPSLNRPIWQAGCP